MDSIALRSAGAVALGIACGLGLGSCRTDGTFTCASDEQCTGQGAGRGRCEPAGYCSFEDPACPSGRRYGGHAAAGLADVCTPEGDTDPSTGTPAGDESPGTGSRPGSSSTTDDDGPAATLAIDEGSSTSAPSGGSSGDDATSGSTGTDGPGGTDTGEPLCPTLEDDFEDGAIDPVWTVWTAEKVEETGGELRLAISPPYGEYAAIVSPPMDLTSGWVRAELGLVPATGFEQLYLALRPEGTTSNILLLLEGQLIVAREDAGMGFIDHAYVKFDPELHRWLQLRGEDGQIVFETSADGSNFDLVASAETSIPLDAVEVAFVGGAWADIPEPTVVSLRHVQACDSPGG